jgi:group I intron endonuclease
MRAARKPYKRSVDAICGIYQIYNIINGKVYIGQAVDIFKRKNSHFLALEGNYHYNSHLQKSFNKYGKECFKFSIIDECSEDELDEREIYYIEQYDSFYTGYNETLGGNGGTSGRKWTKTQSNTMSEKMKNNKYGLGNRSHIGLTQTQETKDKIGKSLLGRKRGKYKTKKNDLERNDK